MKEKNIMIAMLFVMLFALSGCTLQNTGNATNNNDGPEIEKIEIYHFHTNDQCSSCIAVGALAEETVETYYADELKSGKIVFEHINVDMAENNDLAGKYGVLSSSLWIGVYTEDGQFKAEQNMNVWYKINNKEDYMSYLKGIIDKRLAGDFS